MSRERRRKRWWRSAEADVAAEGGCCLLEFIGAATCLALFGIIPLLVR